MTVEFIRTQFASDISSLAHLGDVGDVYTAERLALGQEYSRSVVALMSTTYHKSGMTESAPKSKVCFVLMTSELVEKLERNNEYRDVFMTIRASVRQQNPNYDVHVESFTTVEDIVLNGIDMGGKKTGEEARNDTEKEIDDMLLQAFNMNASDIHIECGDHSNSIKFRIDGELVQYGNDRNKSTLHTLVKVLYSSLAAQAGSIQGTGFNAKEKLDGQLVRQISNRRLGARIASHSTNKRDANFYMVLRCTGDQDLDAERIPFEKLGFRYNQIEQIRNATNGKGITLLIGETNSGKSVTQENLLMEIDASSGKTKNILSVEDPIERNIKGVKQFTLIQSGVSNLKQKEIAVQELLSFIVRADPDDIAVGEINSSFTCEAAVQSSLTGHNVMATLHCDSPFDIPERLTGLGANPQVLQTSEVLKLAVAQKLFKKLCPHCSLTMDQIKHPTAEQFNAMEQLGEMGLGHWIKDVRWRNHEGCSECRNRGIRGRQLVAEVVKFTPEILSLSGKGDKIAARSEWLRHNNFTRFDIALSYIREGKLDPTDVIEQFDALNSAYRFRVGHQIEHPKVIYR
ncbi:putative ATP-binding protein [Vibrio nigripulchritudo SOn1]|uniref:ATP-binding protein n=1 Tax=Vibrio nigripulchritudo SOn1 TaxID=1238450 RepID=A0AAV2VQ91_9VIBR|nr:ATPase, T2SS/T4P/T4SS family [Vibrio nigripulchritudo]CCO46817.1 putative ATP-binding protein [Vibrio nigripulchritudo SOn1]